MSGLLLPILFGGPRTLKIPLTGALPPGWTFTRAGNTATMWQGGVLIGPLLANTPRFETDVNGKPTGYLNEPAATNIYLNSQAPATQTITVTAQAYTLSFYGTGTIAMTGTYTGTLAGTGIGNLVQKTFTPTAGLLVATLTGSVSNVQLEAGPSASSRIITAGSPVTRNDDILTAPLSLYPWLQMAGGWSFALRFSTFTNTPSSTMVLWSFVSAGSTSNEIYIRLSSISTILAAYYVSGVVKYTDPGTMAPVGTPSTYAVSVSQNGANVSYNRAPVVVGPAQPGLPVMANMQLGGLFSAGAVASMHTTSLTLRAGPSSNAWLQGGNY
jgi:hypothetical protein